MMLHVIYDLTIVGRYVVDDFVVVVDERLGFLQIFVGSAVIPAVLGRRLARSASAPSEW